ncbi:hypothetical protein BH24PSE2_BH24PSE2_17680 [soil metagenome]
MNAYYRTYELPWTLSAEQERRFRRILLHVAGVLGVLCLLMPWLPVPEPDPLATENIPPRLARLILEKPAAPPPPAVQPAEPVVAPEPLAPTVEQPPPARVAEQQLPLPAPTRDRAKSARDTAAAAGLLRFADDLAELRNDPALARIASARELTGAVGEAPRSERALVTSRVGEGSGGIDTASLSRDTGGADLAGRTTTRVSAARAGDGQGTGPSASGEKAARSREEIEMIFDRNKGAIYALYNRALRQDPTLEGKLVLRLTIAPSGEVTMCEIVSSDLDAPELERKLVARVKLFRFEAKDVAPVTTTKPIDFFPA